MPRALLGLGLALGLVACRAQVSTTDLGEPDLAEVGDGGGGAVDLVGADLACSGPAGPEVCDNGCDDDGNGFIDADDPACTPQLLVTFSSAQPLTRLLLPSAGAPSLHVLDATPLAPQVFATRVFGFDPAAFVVHDNTPAFIERLVLSPTGTGTSTSMAPPWGGTTRDVCVFGGDLVVVERAASSRLHRLAPDGQTERGTAIALTGLLATGCASDGRYLYVAAHDQTGAPSLFKVYDQTYTELASSPWPLPSGLPVGVDRCLDLAWTPRGMYGLFVDAAGDLRDPLFDGRQLWPFSFDGGVGPPIDAGVLHGIGELR